MARLEQTGLVVVVAVERLVLQLAAACNADARLLIRDEVRAAAVPFCSFAEALAVERAASTVDRLLCKEVDTWLVDRLDPFELFPPMVSPVVLLAAWLAVGEAGVTVDSCSCISIMWSPSRMVRFRGALPDRKSFTCESFRLSNACITLCSGRCASRPVSTLGNNVSRLPSCRRFSSSVPSRSSLSRCSKQMRSLATFSLLEMIFFRFSTVSV